MSAVGSCLRPAFGRSDTLSGGSFGRPSRFSGGASPPKQLSKQLSKLFRQNTFSHGLDRDSRPEAPPPPPNHTQLTLLDGWLFRTPVFKFVNRQALNVATAVIVSTANPNVLGSIVVEVPSGGMGELAPADGDAVCGGTLTCRQLALGLLLWAIGGCWAEYRQLASSRRALFEELLSLFRKDVPSHYFQDAVLAHSASSP